MSGCHYINGHLLAVTELTEGTWDEIMTVRDWRGACNIKPVLHQFGQHYQIGHHIAGRSLALLQGYEWQSHCLGFKG
ncbi:MAG: hypothetical protein R2778_16660 [Saprospiraceae bacterium]